MAVLVNGVAQVTLDGKVHPVNFDLGHWTWMQAAAEEFAPRPSPVVAPEIAQPWARNVQQHIRLDGHVKPESALHVPIIGKTAIVVGCGPSLKETSKLLQDPAVRRNYTIIGVNASLNFVNNPNFYVFTERNWCIEGWRQDGAWQADCMVTTPYSEYLTVPSLRPPRVFYANEDYTTGISVMARELWGALSFAPPMRIVPPIQETMNLALWTALWTGAKAVILVGMDYCYTDTYYAGDPIIEGSVPGDFLRTLRLSRETEDMNSRTVRQTPLQATCLYRTKLILNSLRQRGVHIVNATGCGMLTEAVDAIVPLEEALVLY